MRPTFLPKGLGFNFNQIVYRAIVTCNGERGVHFLRSDANNRLMCLAGNLFSFFRFQYADIENIKNNKIHKITVQTNANEADITASFDLSKAEKKMPASSVFNELEEAKNYFAELYVAFSTLPKYTTAVHIRRTNWDVSLVSDSSAKYKFMDGSRMFPSGSTRLDSIFYVENLFYHWNTLEKSRIEP